MDQTSDIIHVGIIEDEREFRDAVCEYLNGQDGACCDIAVESAEEFFAKTSGKGVPDVILVDIGLPGMSGISAIKLIKEYHPGVDVIMLTVYMDAHKIFQSLFAGASGYLLKATPFPEILQGVRDVHAGGSPMSPQIARKVIEYFQPEKSRQKEPLFTSKEMEVITGLVEGLSYKMIGSRLGVSIETVRSHIKNIYKKMHVHGKAEVISKSLKGEI